MNLVLNFEMVENPVAIRCHPVVALVGSQDRTAAQIGLFISAT